MNANFQIHNFIIHSLKFDRFYFTTFNDFKCYGK